MAEGKCLSFGDGGGAGAEVGLLMSLTPVSSGPEGDGGRRPRLVQDALLYLQHEASGSVSSICPRPWMSVRDA